MESKHWIRIGVGLLIAVLFGVILFQVQRIVQLRDERDRNWHLEAYRDMLLRLNVPAEAIAFDAELMAEVTRVRLAAWEARGVQAVSRPLPVQKALQEASNRSRGDRREDVQPQPEMPFIEQTVDLALYREELSRTGLQMSEEEAAKSFRRSVGTSGIESVWLDEAVRACEKLIYDAENNTGIGRLLEQRPNLFTQDVAPALRRLLPAWHPPLRLAAAEALLYYDDRAPATVSVVAELAQGEGATAERARNLMTLYNLETP